MRLTPRDHDRGAAGLRWVYPVVSRRAAGVSIGINLNPNRACNWRCIYCQVPDLVRGAPEPFTESDLDALEAELRGFMESVLRGDFMAERVPEEARHLRDIAFSGDGEPTLLAAFPEVVERVGRVLADEGLLGELKVVLITNGSRLARPEVRRGIETLARLGGEVWFKLDAVGAARALVNDAQLPDDRVAENLARCARVCPTRLQICLFARDGEPPAEGDLARLLAFIRSSLDAGVELRDALLYTIARQPLQPEGPRLSALAPQYLEEFARRLRSCGLATSVSA
ncbi:MAG TPA: radical SAM protein [Planctomycetota bacterium]|nr:radical SAM protein [Planctomycetota bacterium]